jgi:hypothetical protein
LTVGFGTAGGELVAGLVPVAEVPPTAVVPGVVALGDEALDDEAPGDEALDDVGLSPHAESKLSAATGTRRMLKRIVRRYRRNYLRRCSPLWDVWRSCLSPKWRVFHGRDDPDCR